MVSLVSPRDSGPPAGGQLTVGGVIYTVYAISNQESGKLYIGQTNNIERRIEEHNSKRGNHYSAKFTGEWKLIYQESAATRTEALRREKQLKSARGRQFLGQYKYDQITSN